MATGIESDADPVACTLTRAELATQRERWRQLAARALIERLETEHGLRLSFREEAGVEEELRALAQVEAECCAWADWTVQTASKLVALDVTSTGEGITALHHMFTNLHVGGAV